jgi:hypothetical protein
MGPVSCGHWLASSLSYPGFQQNERVFPADRLPYEVGGEPIVPHARSELLTPWIGLLVLTRKNGPVSLPSPIKAEVYVVFVVSTSVSILLVASIEEIGGTDGIKFHVHKLLELNMLKLHM